MDERTTWITKAIGGAVTTAPTDNAPTEIGRTDIGRLAIASLAEEKHLNRSGFALSSAAFEHGGELDPSFSAYEEDAVAPPLEWTAPPPGSMELVLVVEDIDAPGQDAACHWVVWGLAAQRGKLLEGEVPPRTGKNARGNSEWLLPSPSDTDGEHRYLFQLFAVDLPLTLMPGAKRDDVLASIKGHITAVSVLMGRFSAPENDDEDWDDDGLEEGM